MRARMTAVAVVLMVAAGAALPAEAADGPAPGAVVIVGDYGSGDAAEADVARLVSHARPAAVVTAGDNVYDSDDYSALVGSHYGPWVAGERMYPALGNHDYSEGIGAYFEFFDYLGGNRYYSTVVGDVQYFVIDSQGALDSAADRARQRSWLARSLRESAADWQVVVMHHPPYSSGVEHGSSVSMRWPYRLWGADLVVAGHEHQYERIVRQGLTYVVDGAGGKDLYPFGPSIAGSRVRFDQEHGALFLKGTPSSLSGEFWSVAGSRIDRFAITRG